MAKTFAEYAREREATMSSEARELSQAFDAAAMFGSVLYKARRVRNLRQVDLAEASGVTQADISRIERGMIVPKVTTLLKLVEALDAQLRVSPRIHVPRRQVEALERASDLRKLCGRYWV